MRLIASFIAATDRNNSDFVATASNSKANIKHAQTAAFRTENGVNEIGFGWKYRKTAEYDYSYSGEVFSVRTLPPGFDLATTTVSMEDDYAGDTSTSESAFTFAFYLQKNYEMLPVKQMTDEFGEPAWITMSPEEDMIRLDWSVPEGSLCDAFYVNYTILSLTRPKSYSVATVDEFTIIKVHQYLYFFDTRQQSVR
ncbi:unnamed protein product [Strongylus vulgaris]|uniref:Fibronectin type-III domain-containing protein n=1 Tax=Strongylus vulgaris TaxID=40348 RepID=A0A3P7LFG4_STRVU|nr:unnamed protein product [Strongylus vulgaris]